MTEGKGKNAIIVGLACVIFVIMVVLDSMFKCTTFEKDFGWCLVI
jgi:hypothetical protein